MREFNKILGVGISRTGTTSLAVALRALGIPTVHWPLGLEEICANRAAVDITVACRFQELDRIFPGSLFIYTERHPRTWLTSVNRHYRRLDGTLRLRPGENEFAQEADIRIYGSVRPTLKDFAPAYKRHHASVLDYFRGQDHRLLRMRIVEGDDWRTLCPFLGLPVLSLPFPRVNPAKGALLPAETAPEEPAHVDR